MTCFSRCSGSTFWLGRFLHVFYVYYIVYLDFLQTWQSIIVLYLCFMEVNLRKIDLFIILVIRQFMHLWIFISKIILFYEVVSFYLLLAFYIVYNLACIVFMTFVQCTLYKHYPVYIVAISWFGFYAFLKQQLLCIYLIIFYESCFPNLGFV